MHVVLGIKSTISTCTLLNQPNNYDKHHRSKVILIIGATASIERSFAYAIRNLPTKLTVILAGRRRDRIDEITKMSERFGGTMVDL
ncbi:hypothetical protein BDY19DRAFT_913831 [Irpex rosettiformis]|uniref:Uncharacterized protein n=1 Tax=Irpex rosettiformis TaxID=378272 RepID=A0ACB8UJT1_9APHY|nr:hypothetical protein BDY19DRAFT_913831 [Irpex rosettiformis]